MAYKVIPIEEFIETASDYVVVDVRSPSEFAHAHFPNALSFPLFNDEERKEVGTAYKQKSREEAIKLGLDFFGPKMKKLLQSIESVLVERKSKTVLIYCWRGGMRSAAVAWLLDLYGFKVFVLKGGYKQFRTWTLNQFKKQYNLRVLSGYTGSGKTDILEELAKLNEATIDLEGMVSHRGSAFGGIGLPEQPSNEYFENKLALRLYHLTINDENRPIWVESESSRIGKDTVNHVFHNQMKAAACIHIEVPLAARLKNIVKLYGQFDKEDLIAGVGRIEKRLGGLRTKNAIQFIENGEIEKAFEILIKYYDKAYHSSTNFQPPSIEIVLPNTDAEKNAQIILEKVEIYHGKRCNKIDTIR